MSDDIIAGTDADTWDADNYDADNYEAIAVYEGLLHPVPLESGSPPGPGTSLSFVAYLTVNDKLVTIESGNLLRLAEEGIEFKLPAGEHIVLGSLQDLVNWFCEQMQLQRPDWTNLPTPLQQITGAVATITTLYVKADKVDVKFDIAVSLEFKDGWQIIGKLKLERFTFRLSRLQSAT